MANGRSLKASRNVECTNQLADLPPRTRVSSGRFSCLRLNDVTVGDPAKHLE
jgi:hypothetical protein